MSKGYIFVILKFDLVTFLQNLYREKYIMARNRKNQNKKGAGAKNYFKFIAIVLAILLIYVIAMGVWFGFYMKSKIDHNKDVVASDTQLALEQGLKDADAAVSDAAKSPREKAEEQLAEAGIFGSIPDKTFFGIYGVDQDEKLSDVIIVACFDKNTKTINALSVPRDTYVTLSDSIYGEMKEDGHFGPKTMKINAVHSWGEEDGAKYLTEELEEMLGIPQISYYITVNVEAFQKIVDDMGGITIDVPQDMYYNDATQDLYIDLKAGEQQHLDGYQAMGLVRFRKYTNGDVDRVQVQQQFLHTLMEQALSKENILRNINKYTETFLTYVKTNMSVTDALKYTPFFPVLTEDSLTMATLPGGLRDGDSGYFIDPDRTGKLVDILFYDGDGDPSSYSGLSWSGVTSDSATAVADHEERELEESDNSEALRATIDYAELAELNDKNQYFQKLANIIEDYPTLSNQSRDVIAEYIEFASSSYCNRAYYSEDGKAIINAEKLSGLSTEVKSFCDDMVQQLRDAEIGLARDVRPIARVDISGFDYDKPIETVISKDVLSALDDMSRLLILVGDNLHQIIIEKDDLETIFEDCDELKITFEETPSGYNITFKDQNDNKIKELAAPVSFGFYTIHNSPTCYMSTSDSVENIGGIYDGNNKCLIFSTLKSGEYLIQNAEDSFEALSEFGSYKKERITNFLLKGYVDTQELDVSDTVSREDFMDIVTNMLKKDGEDVLKDLNIEEDGNLTYGELLAAGGKLLNVYKHSYFPNNPDYYLELYKINDNKDEFDNPVSLAIDKNLLNFNGDTLSCKAEANQGDTLNVLANVYNKIFAVSPAEYFFNETEAPPVPEPIAKLSELLNPDMLVFYIALCIFGLAALFILIVLIGVIRKSKTAAKKENTSAGEAPVKAENKPSPKDDYSDEEVEYEDDVEYVDEDDVEYVDEDDVEYVDEDDVEYVDEDDVEYVDEEYDDDDEYIYEDDEEYIYEYDEDEEYDDVEYEYVDDDEDYDDDDEEYEYVYVDEDDDEYDDLD